MRGDGLNAITVKVGSTINWIPPVTKEEEPNLMTGAFVSALGFALMVDTAAGKWKGDEETGEKEGHNKQTYLVLDPLTNEWQARRDRICRKKP